MSGCRVGFEFSDYSAGAMSRVEWLALAAEVELELMAIKARVKLGLLDKSKVVAETSDLHWVCLTLYEQLRDGFRFGMVRDLLRSIESLEKELGLFLCCPF